MNEVFLDSRNKNGQHQGAGMYVPNIYSSPLVCLPCLTLM